MVAELSRITTLHPRTYNEARTIGENFREGVPVIMNLGEMDDADAKRLVDFAAGLVFGVRGTIERVTNKVFLLSPPNVSVAAEDKQRIAEHGGVLQPELTPADWARTATPTPSKLRFGHKPQCGAALRSPWSSLARLRPWALSHSLSGSCSASSSG